MLEILNMLMIGGNSRHAGKTTLACRIIRKLSGNFEVTAIKVTSVRPEESGSHGNHIGEDFSGFRITRETDTLSAKDTSMMLRAGATRVFYIRADEEFVEQAIAQFLREYDTGQPIICESRSLRKVVKPGLFMMMMRQRVSAGKDVTQYLPIADKVLYYSEDQADIINCTEKVSFKDQKFIWV